MKKELKHRKVEKPPMAIKQQINIIKMPILLKEILTQCISIKISILFFMKQKKNPKIPNTQSNPEQKQQCRRHHSVWF